ncbi:MAG: DNA-processing protein DprA [Anaerolineae bacterium]
MDDDLRYWIGFNRVNGIGPVRLRALQDYFGDLATAWHAEPEALRAAGLDARLAEGVTRLRAHVDLDAELERVERAGITLLTLDSPDYPRLLRQISGAPPLLYVKGELTLDDEFAVAVVGTRAATTYGRAVTERLSTELAQHNVTVVSGLAVGIDTFAHHAALQAGGRTVAVLACGLDIVYPASNKVLAERIAGQGALVSEHPLGTRPDAHHFPARNRIVSGLSLGVLITEAGESSGALITARMAAEQGRDVFAVPGRITDVKSAGTNGLIQTGAKLVTSVRDIVEELNLRTVVEQRTVQLALPEDETERALIGFLSADPVHIDELRRAADLPMPVVSATLALLEVKGLVRQVGGMNYVVARETAAPYRIE